LSPAGIELAIANTLVPGRHLQAIYLERRTTLGEEAERRLLLRSRVTREGWGYYAEHLIAEQERPGGNAEQRLLLARRSLLANCRFAACVRIHARGMPLEQAAALFESEAFVGPEGARLEVVRCANDPLTLAGGLGKSLILELREDYRKSTGERSPRSFHDSFLKRGAIPIPLIRRCIMTEQTG
jgi:uncharacterized protein (DUF885 family)